MNKINFIHGLCTKLGKGEFSRQLADKKRRQQGIKPRKFTGLSVKMLGRAEYDKQYKKLKTQ